MAVSILGMIKGAFSKTRIFLVFLGAVVTGSATVGAAAIVGFVMTSSVASSCNAGSILDLSIGKSSSMMSSSSAAVEPMTTFATPNFLVLGTFKGVCKELSSKIVVGGSWTGFDA